MNQKTSNKVAISTYLSIITLNASGLNVSMKRHRMADWIKKKTHTIKPKIHPCAAYKRSTSELKAHRLKVR